MLTHPTLDKLHTLKLTGMARGLEGPRQLPDIHALNKADGRYIALMTPICQNRPRWPTPSWTA